MNKAPLHSDLEEQLKEEWRTINKSNDIHSSFVEWKENSYKGGCYIYLLSLDSIVNSVQLKQGFYWIEIDNGLKKIRSGGPFESNLDAAADLGSHDYKLYKSLKISKFPSVSPFEFNQNLHRAWSNGFELQMVTDNDRHHTIKYPDYSGYYWFISKSIKTICHINNNCNPPSINSLTDLTNSDLKQGKWIGPIKEPIHE